MGEKGALTLSEWEGWRLYDRVGGKGTNGNTFVLSNQMKRIEQKLCVRDSEKPRVNVEAKKKR